MAVTNTRNPLSVQQFKLLNWRVSRKKVNDILAIVELRLKCHYNSAKRTTAVWNYDFEQSLKQRRRQLTTTVAVGSFKITTVM